MKPKMAAAQLEARLEARLSTTNPTYACSGAIKEHQIDCEEKRDPDEYKTRKNERNELDLNTQLEKRPLGLSTVALDPTAAKRTFQTLGEFA